MTLTVKSKKWSLRVLATHFWLNILGGLAENLRYTLSQIKNFLINFDAELVRSLRKYYTIRLKIESFKVGLKKVEIFHNKTKI